MRWTRYDWIALVAVTLLAAVLRMYQLGVVPPGFQFDEAFNAIDAQQVLAGNRPLFLPANAGREVIYTYWQAFLVFLFGLNVRTLRLASALFGILAVPVTYILLRMMLRRCSRAIALFTSLVLATSLWHIHFSHYGIRVIMMPVVFSLAFGAFWLGYHADRKQIRLAAYVVSGLFIGLSVWTHPTGRLAPIVVLLYTLWLLWQEPESRRFRVTSPVGGLLLSGVVAFVVFLPLGLEFAAHPEFFIGHASEVSIFAERVSGESPLATLGENALRVAGMFAVAGDREWTHNLAGRPVFDLLMAAVFFVGLAIWGLRVYRGASRASSEAPDADALVLLAVWAIVMLLPSVFSEAAPNYSRTLPALPALFLATGLGLTWVSGLRGPFQHAGVVIAALILVFSGSRSAYDYFVAFPAQEDVYYVYDADKLDALEYLAGLTDGNQVYLSQLWGNHHATVAMLRGELGVKSLDTSDTLVLPPEGKGAIYAFPSEQVERAEQLAELWTGIEVRQIPDDYGTTLLHLVEVPPGMAQSLPERYGSMRFSPAAFERAPDLAGQYAAEPDKQITLLWEADEELDVSLTSYVHLIDPDGRRVAQVDKLPGNGSYRTDDWTVGELVLDRYYPAMIDPCAAGVPLRAQVGWYSATEGHAPRPRADASGETALAGTVTLPILSHDPGYLRPQIELSEGITDGLTFRGFNVIASETQPGSPMTVDLYWRSEHDQGNTPVYAGAPLTLTLVNDEAIHPIWSGELAPDSDWDPGQEICRRIRTSIPPDISSGVYSLRADLGTPDSGTTREVILRDLDVSPSTRLFEEPSLAARVNATLAEIDSGDEFRLLGVVTSTMESTGTNALEITLAWKAGNTPHGNYRVFVHLVDAAGNIVTQSDATPGPDYPTNRWIGGEVVLDRHTLSLPEDALPGLYQIVAGMYDPVSAVRLTAHDESGDRYLNDGVLVQEALLP